jgi:hypothetical protein
MVLSIPRINELQPVNIFKIRNIAGNQGEFVDQGGSGNYSIGQFYLVFFTYIGSLIFNGLFQFNNKGVVNKIV